MSYADAKRGDKIEHDGIEYVVADNWLMMDVDGNESRHVYLAQDGHGTTAMIVVKSDGETFRKLRKPSAPRRTAWESANDTRSMGP